jgi:hypothetical protein
VYAENMPLQVLGVPLVPLVRDPGPAGPFLILSCLSPKEAVIDTTTQAREEFSPVDWPPRAGLSTLIKVGVRCIIFPARFLVIGQE